TGFYCGRRKESRLASDLHMAANGFSASSPPRVVVVGSGFAGLETAFNLRAQLGERAAISLVSDQDHFYFKPNSLYIPFGLDPHKLRIPLERPTKRKGIELVRARAHGVDTGARRVETDAGPLDFDYLVLATGSGMRAEEVPGLAENAISTWSAQDMLALRAAFDHLLETSGEGGRRRVLFLVPPNNMCAGPLYEIVLMYETWLRRRRSRAAVEISWATCEQSFIAAFGPRLHDVVADEFEQRGIRGQTGQVVSEVGENEVRFAGGESLGFDLLVSFPPYVASTEFPGLPASDRGFLDTDLASREVVGNPGIYAVGDAGDFPVKQAFLAFLQADAAAAHIAAQIGGEDAEGTFDPVSMCVMEQFDKATFAQVPLQLTGDPDHPVEVRAGAGDDYIVGSSPGWRLGKKMLAVSVPFRFRNGEPFHAGAFWGAMDLGLQGMSRLLATSGPAETQRRP
ncbi:MAG: NAD(P)/FAD-dependent oxidoreductase, partial [Solirubrobacterales bacterium]